MKKLTFSIAVLIFLVISGTFSNGQDKKPANNNPDNTLTDKEVKEGWKLLFDGKSGANWMNAKSKTFPAKGWIIKDGTLTVTSETGTQWKELVATSKFKTSPGFGEVAEGRLLLQDHGNVVSFKNIKIREIKD
jgi:hypothetical protein